MAFHDVLIVDLRELLLNKSNEDDVPQFCPVGAKFSNLFVSFEKNVLQSPAYKTTKIYFKQEEENWRQTSMGAEMCRGALAQCHIQIP